MRRSLRSIAIAGVVGVVAMPVAASAAPPPWHAQNSTVGSNVTLKGIEVTDSCHGWAVGEPGETHSPGTRTPIVATRNGGRTWFKQQSGIQDTTLNRVDFVDNTHGWAVGEPFETGGNDSAPGLGAILRTTNGGTTWTQQTTNVAAGLDLTASNDLEGVSFISRQLGWIAVGGERGTGTMRGAILHTTDGGASYAIQAVPDPTLGIGDVAFVDATHGWAVNDNGDILNTTDGGANWLVQFASTGPALEAVAFYNLMRGVAVGESGTVWTTTDGGTNWNPGVIAAPFGTFDDVTLTDVSFPTANLVGVSTDQEFGSHGNLRVLISTDGGAVLRPQDSGTINTLNSISYARGTNHGWLSGSHGTIRSNNPNAGAGC